MEARKVPDDTKIIVTESDNIYLAAVKALYLKEKTPTAEQVLLEIMQAYLKRGESYLSQQNHLTMAKDIKAMLEKHQFKDALIYLKSIESMNIAGDFALAIATFFNFVPHSTVKELNPVFQHSIWQNLWAAESAAWINSYMNAHAAGKGSNDHENMEHIAASVPNEMADGFADFLLAELDKKRPESDRPGLYNGWVCIAFSKIADKLSETKKQAVCLRLKSMLARKREDYSMIGLVTAISKMTKDGDTLNAAAVAIHKYTMDKLLTLKAAMLSKNQTVSSYLAKVFDILYHFESYYKQDKRNELIRLFINEDDIFSLRAGINTMHSWMQPPECAQLIKTLKTHPNFEILFTCFYSWFTRLDGGVAVEKKFNVLEKKLLGELADKDLVTHFTEHLELITLDDKIPVDKKKLVLENLRNKVVTASGNNNMQPEQKNNLFKAMRMVKPWIANEHTLDEIYRELDHALKAHPTNDHGLRANIMATIFSLLPPYAKYTHVKLRNELLTALSQDPDTSVADALRCYARKAPLSAMPDLLSCLASIDSDKEMAHALFLELHQDYLRKTALQLKPEEKNEEQAVRTLGRR